MKDNIGTAALVFFILLIGFASGYHTGISSPKYDQLRKQCARENNVYECMIVAVPKGEE